VRGAIDCQMGLTAARTEPSDLHERWGQMWLRLLTVLCVRSPENQHKTIQMLRRAFGAWDGIGDVDLAVAILRTLTASSLTELCMWMAAGNLAILKETCHDGSPSKFSK